MSFDQRNQLQQFRNKLYHSCFPRRRDAIFELLDANCATRDARSVISLCKSPYFTRQYPSITDALTDGLEVADWENAAKLLWKTVHPTESAPYYRFALDCTPNSRLHARKSDDRSIVHYPNPAPGNKPICAGHEYSVVAYLPPGNSKDRKTWCVPLSVERVPSHHKGSEFGLSQMNALRKTLNLKQELCVTVGDTAYSNTACQKAISEQSNSVHIARLKSNRNVYDLLAKVEGRGPGQPKRYDRKMALNQPETLFPHDEEIFVPFEDFNGSPCVYQVTAWNEKVFKSTKEFKAHEHPFRLIRVIALNSKEKPIFKRPMWLAVFGDKRMELSIAECCDNYFARYDIEHFNRFGKQSLLMDSYQSAEVTHEENWWRLCGIAYNQLYLSRHLTHAMPETWERYLPEFKHTSQDEFTTPAMTQRGFSKVLDDIGTPAKEPISRGNPLGRQPGECPEKRSEKPIVFKGSQAKKSSKGIPKDFKKTFGNSKPEDIQKTMQQIKRMLCNAGISVEEFCDFALNSA